MTAEQPARSRFWKNFVDEYWEKRPCIFRLTEVEPLISSTQAFANILAASQEYEAGVERVALRFFIESGRIMSDHGLYWPRAEDGSFAAYESRMTKQLDGRGFGIILHELSYYDFALFTRARQFLAGLYEHVGLPGRKTDVDLFIGTYRKTPFGVHKDTGSNFCYVFEGRKRFLLWPSHLLDDRDLNFRTQYEAVSDQALELEAGPGEVIYWPSSYWHIAVSDGELSGVMNLALYLDDDSDNFVRSSLEAEREPLPKTPIPTTLPWDPWFSSGARIPEKLERVLDTYRTAEEAEEARRQAMLRAWVIRTSAFNFIDCIPPMRAQRALKMDEKVRVGAFPIVVVEHGEQLLCAAHGHCCEVPAIPRLRAIVERINAGSAVLVKQLVDEAAGRSRLGDEVVELDPEDVLQFLENLLAMRAIDLV